MSGFVDPDQNFELAEIDGQPYTERATIQFPEPGIVRGKAPCNSYGGEQNAPYPWLEFGTFRVSRMHCQNSAAEKQFFAALSSMTQVEALDDTLILRNENGAEMVFVATHP